MTRRAVARLLALTTAVLAASAHIGSPDVWLEGRAGPYPVVVNVQVPGVVPGVAQVYVRVTGDGGRSGVRQVSVTTNKFDATGGAPPPDVADPVAGDPGLYHAPLWIMVPGSNTVTVFVAGALGRGQLVVPVVAVPNQRMAFSRPLAIVLSIVGILLFLGAMSILGAVTREAVLPPGATPDPRRRVRARFVMAGTALVLGVVLLGGWRWWDLQDAYHARTLYKPMDARAVVRTGGGVSSLDLVITDSVWARRHDTLWFQLRAPTLLTRRNTSAMAPLIPDHGKLMHLFLIREPDMTSFAHLHPTTSDSVTFSTPLPSLPAGRYRVLADVVQESGEAQTITATAELPVSGDTTAKGDPDDSWYTGRASTSGTAALADGSVMHWERGTVPLVVGHPAPLTFTVTDSAGRLEALEPYMGMAAHTIVLRDDGAVFVHLHPTGTVPMGAQEAFALRRSTDTVMGMVARRMQSDSAMAMAMPMAMPMGPISGPVRIPYAFPKPGHYHIWVQVKRGGKVLTGAFEADVKA